MLASETTSGLLPLHFGSALLTVTLVSVLVSIMALICWKVIDRITPGNLDGQLLGTPATEGKPERAPNIALAIVVGAISLGFSFIIGCTIIGVLAH